MSNLEGKRLHITEGSEPSFQSSELLIHSATEIGVGQFSSVNRIIVSLGEDEETFSFAYKRFFSPNPARLEEAVAIHDALRAQPKSQEYALEVVKKADEGLVMTDLSENGKNLVMSSNDSDRELLVEAKRINEENPGFIADFVDSMDRFPDNPEWEVEFQAKAELVARETAQAHVVLASDSVFFVLAPKGNYKLFVVDVDNAHLSPDLPTEDLQAHNLRKIYGIKPHIEQLWFALGRLK